MRTLAATLAAACFLLSPAFAADTDNLDVSLTVAASCNITGAALDFGSVSTLTTGASNIDASANLSVICTSEAPYEIRLGPGLNALVDQRRLKSAAATTNIHLNYELYSDVGHTTVWSTGVGHVVEATGNGAAQTHTVYGVVPSGQNVSLGDYADTVVATVWYGTP